MPTSGPDSSTREKTKRESPRVPRPEKKRAADVMLFSEAELRAQYFTGVVSRVRSMDRELFSRVIQSGTPEGLEGRIQSIDNLEILANGTETRRANMSGGINETSSRTYALGAEQVRAVVKPQRGETSYTVRNGKMIRLKNVWDEAKGKTELQEFTTDESNDPYSPEEAAAVESILGNAEALRRDCADYYGVEPEQIPLNDREFCGRRGIQAGDLAMREVFASRLSLLTGMNVVPETSIVADSAVNSDTGETTHENIDLASAQMFVRPENPGTTKGEMKKKRAALLEMKTKDPAAYANEIAKLKAVMEGTASEADADEYLTWSSRNIRNLLVLMGEEDKSKYEAKAIRGLTGAEFQAMLEQGPDHPRAKYVMRIACMNYLAKSSDTHIDNIIVDTTSDKLSLIDNGLSGGLSRRSKTPNENGDHEEPVDPYRSVMWEAVDKHPDWQLDDEAVEELKELHGRLVGYMQTLYELSSGGLSDKGVQERLEAEMKKKTGGAEVKYLSELYSIIYRNKKIASKELNSLIKRIGYLITHRRPPTLPSAANAMQPGNAMFRYEPHMAQFTPSSDYLNSQYLKAVHEFDQPEGDDEPA